MDKKDEIELVEGCIKGNRKDQERLFKKFASKMYAVCLSYSKDEDAAKDILQDSFIKIFSNIKEYSHDFPLERWVRRIIVNTAIDYYRKRIKMVWVKYEFVEEIVPDEKADVFSRINEKQLLEIIKDLPEGYKMVFNLFVVEGYSHKEIAQLLGVSESTSKTQFFHARKMLREKIKALYEDTFTNEAGEATENGERVFKMV